jgi:hypothetical protein
MNVRILSCCINENHSHYNLQSGFRGVRSAFSFYQHLMMFYRKKTVVLAIGLCFGLSANAQEALEDPPENAATPAMTVGVVTVTGKATGPLATRNVLTSVDHAGREQDRDPGGQP